MIAKLARNPHIELALLCLLALMWGSSYLFIKIAVETIPPITLIAARVAIAALLLSAIMAKRKHRFPREPRIWQALFVQSIFNSIGAWTVLAWGQQYVDSGLAGILNSTSPIFVFFITWLWTRHEAVSGDKLIGALLGLAGVILIVGVNALDGFGQNIAAQLAVLSGAMLYGLAAIYGKRFADLPPSVTAACTMIWAAVILIPMSLVIDRPWTLSPSGASVCAALALAIFSTAGALIIYFRLIKTIGSMGVASQAYLRIGVSVLLGMILLGESVDWSVVLGLLAVAMSVAIINGHLRAAWWR
ncbi:putative inner membrane transporter YedA [bacterium MnTg02]|nr:putative inner membrane transporter YedA [bacterium MnTg02]